MASEIEPAAASSPDYWHTETRKQSALEQSFQRHDQLGHDQLALAEAAGTAAAAAVINKVEIVPLSDGKFELRLPNLDAR